MAAECVREAVLLWITKPSTAQTTSTIANATSHFRDRVGGVSTGGSIGRGATSGNTPGVGSGSATSFRNDCMRLLPLLRHKPVVTFARRLFRRKYYPPMLDTNKSRISPYFYRTTQLWTVRSEEHTSELQSPMYL